MQTVAIQDAPQLLNTNDQAMWVLGYNEAVQKMLSRSCTESEQHMQELRAYELTVSNLRAELESVRQGQCLHKIAEPATQAVQPVATITGVDEFGPMFGWYEHWAKFNVGTKLYTHPTPQGLDALEPQIPDDFMAAETKQFGQRHVGRDYKGERVWHTNSDGTFWCGNWRNRTPAELERECLTTVKDLRDLAAQAEQEDVSHG